MIDHVYVEELVALEDRVHPVGEVVALDKAVAVPVVTAQPVDGPVHDGDEGPDEGDIPAPPHVLPRGDDEEGRWIDRIVEDAACAPHDLGAGAQRVVAAEL